MDGKKVIERTLGRLLRKRPLLGGRVVADLLNQIGKVQSVEIELTRDCLLGKSGSVIRMAADALIMPLVVRDGAWEKPIRDVCVAYLNAHGTHDIVDLGANCGLFTRQLYASGAPVGAAFCVEADPRNSTFARYNLQEFSAAQVFNIGLGDHDGEVNFFQDTVNHGNYSFAKASVGDSARTINVAMQETGSFFQPLLPRMGERLLLKCDVQGYDELVLSLIPVEVWNKVGFAVIEITQIEKPASDLGLLAAKLAPFDIVELDSSETWTVDRLMAFSLGRAGGFTDFALTRRAA